MFKNSRGVIAALTLTVLMAPAVAWSSGSESGGGGAAVEEKKSDDRSEKRKKLRQEARERRDKQCDKSCSEGANCCSGKKGSGTESEPKSETENN